MLQIFIYLLTKPGGSDAKKYISITRIFPIPEMLLEKKCQVRELGVKVRNMKMDVNIYGTWRRVRQ